MVVQIYLKSIHLQLMVMMIGRVYHLENQHLLFKVLIIELVLTLILSLELIQLSLLMLIELYLEC